MTVKELNRQRLKNYIACEEAILAGQKYQIGSRVFERPDLAEVQAVISDLIDSGVTLEDEPIKNGRYRRVVFID